MKECGNLLYLSDLKLPDCEQASFVKTEVMVDNLAQFNPAKLTVLQIVQTRSVNLKLCQYLADVSNFTALKQLDLSQTDVDF